MYVCIYLFRHTQQKHIHAYTHYTCTTHTHTHSLHCLVFCRIHDDYGRVRAGSNIVKCHRQCGAIYVFRFLQIYFVLKLFNLFFKSNYTSASVPVVALLYYGPREPYVMFSIVPFHNVIVPFFYLGPPHQKSWIRPRLNVYINFKINVETFVRLLIQMLDNHV